MAVPHVSHELGTGWSFRRIDDGTDNEWMPVKKVPTNVHLDLMDNGKHVSPSASVHSSPSPEHKSSIELTLGISPTDRIPDPFLGFNEVAVEWVNEASWSYKTTLPPVDKPPAGSVTVLAFDGLDTFATVKLNGAVILTSDNMFVPHRVDVTDALDYGSGAANVLEIDFACAYAEARKIKDAHPEHKWVGFNGDMARLAARKAQYHWGWDWGPVLCPCGPWRPVRLEQYSTCVADLRVDYELDASLETVRGTISATLEGASPDSVVAFTTSSLGGQDADAADAAVVFEASAAVDPADGTAKVEFRVDRPRLWYPHGYGAQALYAVRAAVATAAGAEVHAAERRVGFRKGELVQDKDEIGKSFYFRINGVDVFCGGSDWIPADSFTPRISEERYRKWLEMMVDGYQVMIRIWGGGIWEADAFYDICDELGVMVWQDFMFGCGNYPAFPAMRESIRREGTAQLRRLRHHPSIVIYAGNNEDYQVQEQSGLTYDYEDKDPENWLKTDFPARYIYEKILPEIVAAESPHVPYHPGSPWGDGLITSNPTVGDMHQWNADSKWGRGVAVWHGTQEKYQIFDTLGGRFNSEFGMEAFPHIDTIRYYCTDEAQLYPQSHMLDFHNKADGHERRIATYLVENFRTVTDLEGFIHLTQLMQSEALSFGYRGWRRQWGQTPRRCGGALVWQLNDCWPCASWATADYFQRRKPGWYAMRRALAPVAVGVRRAHADWSVAHARAPATSDWALWIASAGPAAVRARVEVRFVAVATGAEVAAAAVRDDVAVAPNATTEVLAGRVDNAALGPVVLAARVWVAGRVVARDVDWPQPLKYLDFADRGVGVAREGDEIVVRADRPTKGLVFEERAGVRLEDSALDVVPGDELRVGVRGLAPGDEMLGWRYLGQE
ncbi:glycoside hydrolase superfamily [Lineolata rhizophorae]|uniref:Beta-mannosidase B n=1 Tax=Lineolata rhizophorae TaxID=578093 RepID=A0A6A6PD45_9PEZI|nr:glycoside hydrolase superfamily [Lineolata rhizophorae]